MRCPSRLVLTSLALAAGFSFACDSETGVGNEGGRGGNDSSSESASSSAGGRTAVASTAGGGSSSSGGASSSSSSSSSAAAGSGGASTPIGGSSSAGGSSEVDSSSAATGGKGSGTSALGGRGGTAKTGGTATGGTGKVGGTTAVGTGTGTGGSPFGTTSTLTGKVRKFFGNIDTRGAIRSDFSTMWDQFSPENAGKWDSVQRGGKDSWNWKTLDAMYKYCMENDIVFKEHTFCWGPQQPSWVNDTNGLAAVKAWMTAFCERYPNTAVIDVFNESLHNSPNYKNALGGSGSSGYDYLVTAFKLAREACPKSILLYNDYNTIEYANENNGVIKLVKAIKAAGAPIDAVGCQAHDVGMVSVSTVKSYTEKIIAETGLPVHITEMDVGKADDGQQLATVKGVVEALWNNEKVQGWTYWGYVQGATWRANTHLMSSSGSKRQALTWLMAFLKRGS